MLHFVNEPIYVVLFLDLLLISDYEPFEDIHGAWVFHSRGDC